MTGPPRESFPARLRRRPLYALLALAALAVAAWGFWPRAVPVETATIARAAVSSSFREDGRTRLRERYVVSAPFDGIVERLLLAPGTRVAAGETLAVLRAASSALADPASRAETQSRLAAIRSERAAAAANVASADAQRTSSAAALRRGENLAGERLIAREALDDLRAQAIADEAAWRSARAREETMALLADGMREALRLQGAPSGHDRELPLRSPVAGVVIRRHVESETTVRIGQPVIEVGDPDELEVVVEVLTADAVRIGAGTPVRLLGWGGERELQGRVRMIEPGGFSRVSALGVEEQRVLAIVDLVDPPETRPGLGDQFRVEAEFLAWRADDALAVPLAALFRDGERWACFVVEGGRARRRHVDIGRIGDEAAEVRDGLAAGERVVLYPADGLSDGDRVRTAGSR